MRDLTAEERREGPDVRERSKRLEEETGADSIETIEHVYDRGPSGAIRCVYPGCKFHRFDAVAMWRHVHDPAVHPRL